MPTGDRVGMISGVDDLVEKECGHIGAKPARAQYALVGLPATPDRTEKQQFEMSAGFFHQLDRHCKQMSVSVVACPRNQTLQTLSRLLVTQSGPIRPTG